MKMLLSILCPLVALAVIIGLIAAVRRGSIGRHGKKIALACLAVVVCLALFHRPVGRTLGNLWGMTTERLWLIPTVSSVWAFEATQENSGSGDWWIYGEDATNFYHFVGPETEYMLFPKAHVPQCPGFQPQDVSTWCPEYRVSRKKE
jgi:hypothetical protein